MCDNIIVESVNKAIKYQKKFCSRSCGASYSNKIRVFKPEWKLKISDTLKQRYKNNGAWGNIRLKTDYKCIMCNININYRRKTCSKECLLKFKKQNPPLKRPGGYRKGSGRGKHGWYDGIYFDSTYELAYYIYCKNNNIDIKRCNEKYQYKNTKGEKRFYYPDFRVNGELVEIKGFLTPDVALKIKAVSEPVQLLMKKELNNVFKFVESKTNLKIKNLYQLYSDPTEG